MKEKTKKALAIGSGSAVSIALACVICTQFANTIAAYALGKLYFYGGSVERDIEKAKEWLTMAAESGNEYAVRLLNRMEQYSCSAVRCTAFGLLKAFGRLISDSHKDSLRSPKMRTESKLRNVIRRKKEALGIKSSNPEQNM